MRPGFYMPHIQFDINKTLSDTDKISLAQQVRQLFADVMDTGTDHISMSLREFDTLNLSLGRVVNPELGVAIINADIRAGRTMEQRRSLCLGLMDLVNQRLGIPQANMYITLTEHKGEDFHLHERYLASWQQGEEPLKD
jgi:phenylpyruvate tautomerase PptA (4-oxalocrotonate tautomerase family)